MLIRILTWALVFAALVTPAHAQKTKSALTTEITGNFPDNAAGSITPQILRTVTTDIVNSSQQYAGVNPQAGTTYTVQTSDYGQLLSFSNVGVIAVSLPQAAASFSPFNFTIQTASTAGNLTITPTGGSTIDGAASYVLSPNTSLWVVSDGTNWQVAKGSGSGTVNIGTATHLAFYATSTGAVSSAPNATIVAGALALGASGTLGTAAFGNATSGTVTLQPVAGALGSAVLTMPAATDTLAVLATAQALTNKTYNGNTFTAGTGTLTIAAGKTLTANNSITIAGVDGKTLTTNNSITIAGTDGKTLTVSKNLTLDGTDGTTQTFPSVSATITRTVAKGSTALNTAAIASGACNTTTSAASGVATTDTINATFNASVAAVTGYAPVTSGALSIRPYPTLNNVNFEVCNSTLASITPGAVTLNWGVTQ